jgi:Carboxypeptidase regulatory-like domain
MRQICIWRRVALLAILAASFSYAHAADVNAHIKGTVTDPAGAVIAKASVIATNEATGIKYTTESSSTGEYLFPQLPIGTYTIKVSAPGFKEFQASGIVLNIAQEYVEPAVLTVGATSDVVEIHADAVQVNTTDMQLSNVVNSTQMVELPLINRAFAGLALTLPGVQGSSDRFGTISVSGAQSQQSSYLVNGADDNDIALNTLVVSPNLDAIDQFNLIDGPLNAEYDRNSGGIVSVTIKQGTNHFHGNVFEFYRDTFLNSNNFFQKTFNAAGQVNNRPATFHQNIFGGTLGGPIFKDKLFFFGAYQGTRQAVPQSTTNVTVYTPAQLGGDFSSFNGTATTRPASATTITNPDGTKTTVAAQSYGTFSNKSIPSSISIPGCTTPLETWAQCAFDRGGKFPTTAFNSISSTLIKQYVPAANSGTNFIYNSTSVTSGNQYIGRFDYALNTRNQFTVVGLYNQSTVSNGLPFSGSNLPGFGDGSLTHSQVWTGDWVHQLSSSAVNDLAGHYTRLDFNSGAPQKTVAPSSVGFAINPQVTTGAQTIPTINLGAPYFAIGGTNNGPQPRVDATMQFDDIFSKTYGHHNLKFGYDFRKFSVVNSFLASNSGAYTFATNNPFSSGDQSLDFVFGNPSSFTQGSGNIIQADAFLNYMFAQDSWKVLPTFTLNYGLGYSIDTPLRNHQFGGIAVACSILSQQSSVFAGAPKGLNYPGDPGCTNSGQAYTRYSEFGPRLGFAWAPDLGAISGSQGKLSIRGGFGMYYNRSEEETSLQTLGTPPFGITSFGAGDFTGRPQFANPYADINNGKKQSAGGVAGGALPEASQPNRFPYIAPGKGASIDFSQYAPIFNISGYGPGFRAPYSENVQLSVEREMPSQIVARLSYVGALGRHNQTAYEGIPITPAGHAACLASPACYNDPDNQALTYAGTHTPTLDPDFAEMGLVGSDATSSYHSLQASVNKAPTHGLSFQMSYTYGHAQDSASSFENSGFGSSGQRGYNQYDTTRNWGDSLFDARHRFVFAPIYVVPSLKSGNWYSPLNLLVSGWQVSGVMTLATGLPYDISYAGGTSLSLWCADGSSFYACPDAPNQTGPINTNFNHRARIAANGNRVQYFAKGSWAPETLGTFGNTHRNPMHGPGINNTNMILAKNFNLSNDGTRQLQLRMESDNVFNHTQFSNPTSTWSDTVPTLATTSFGQISAAAAARQTQLAVKIKF